METGTVLLHLQGYLAHKTRPPPEDPPEDPRHRPTAGS